MQTKRFDKREIKKLVKSKPISGTFNVFENGCGIIKIYKDVMADLLKYGTLIFPFGLADPKQIEWLSSMQGRINGSTLPNGVIYFENYPIGVMYEKYFKGYVSFNKLHQESFDLMFSNFRSSVDKNIELMSNGIFNQDLNMQNILYSSNDVELIDLDGKYIYSNLPLVKVYSYYVYGMMKVILERVNLLYGEDEAKRVASEIKKIMKSFDKQIECLDYPHMVLDEVEKSCVLRLK